MFTVIVTQALQAPFRMIAAAIASIAAALRHRRAIHQLHQLDDRMLADIGLTRTAIGDAVRSGRCR
jgi:uncharacterized protein YjiS (DUF1127 family)